MSSSYNKEDLIKYRIEQAEKTIQEISLLITKEEVEEMHNEMKVLLNGAAAKKQEAIS